MEMAVTICARRYSLPLGPISHAYSVIAGEPTKIINTGMYCVLVLEIERFRLTT